MFVCVCVCVSLYILCKHTHTHTHLLTTVCCAKTHKEDSYRRVGTLNPTGTEWTLQRTTTVETECIRPSLRPSKDVFSRD